MKNAILIFGGKSFEHDISIITALIVYKRARSKNFKLLPVYVTKQNEWFFYGGENLNIDLFKDFEKNKKLFRPAYLKTCSKRLFYRAGIFTRSIEVDAALNCCHGGMGENGELVGAMSLINIPLTSGSLSASSICMDKVLTKDFLVANKIESVKSVIISRGEVGDPKLIASKVETLGYPVILKPAHLGSSIGIEVVHSEEELTSAAKTALEFDDIILVEKVIENMEEYNVAVMRSHGEVLVSRADKAIKKDEILSFKDKYVGDNKYSKGAKNNFGVKKGGAYLEKKTFEKVDPKLEERLKEISKKVYEKLGLEGVVRIDFIVKKNKIYLNEVNTVPGSLGYYFFVPEVFKTMGEFVDALLFEAIEVNNFKSKIKQEYITKLF